MAKRRKKSRGIGGLPRGKKFNPKAIADKGFLVSLLPAAAAGLTGFAVAHAAGSGAVPKLLATGASVGGFAAFGRKDLAKVAGACALLATPQAAAQTAGVEGLDGVMDVFNGAVSRVKTGAGLLLKSGGMDSVATKFGLGAADFNEDAFVAGFLANLEGGGNGVTGYIDADQGIRSSVPAGVQAKVSIG